MMCAMVQVYSTLELLVIVGMVLAVSGVVIVGLILASVYCICVCDVAGDSGDGAGSEWGGHSGPYPGLCLLFV